MVDNQSEDGERRPRRPPSRRPDQRGSRRGPAPAQRPGSGERSGGYQGRRPGQGSGSDHRSARTDEPALPDSVTGHELERHVRRDLGTLSKESAIEVARHLVMAGRLIDADPELALKHAVAAQRRAGRVGVVREAAGLTAYHAGDYEMALRELRTARRLTGFQDHLPVMADCERGLGRPERALALAASPEARGLDRAAQLEMTMVVAGARIDLGQPEAAVVVLGVPELTRRPTPATAEVTARLMSAYSDALAAAGRLDEARTWLQQAADTDPHGSTGAAERLGVGTPFIVDLDDDTDLGDDTVGTGDAGPEGR